MKYVIYLRVSTEQQANSGLGLEAQREKCRNYIPEGSEILEFSDEGFSGALESKKRPALVCAIDSLNKDDILLIANRDRIGRDPIVNAMIEREIEEKKAFLVSASGDFNGNKDPSSVLMRRMVDVFAEYERLIIGVRTRVALSVKKNKNERVGYIPYGYRLCEDGIHLEKDIEEQRKIDLIFSMRNQDISLRKIASEMNSRGEYKRYNKKWNHVSLLHIIRNERARRATTSR